MVHPRANWEIGKWRKGKGQGRAHLLGDELGIASLLSHLRVPGDLTQAAASRHSAFGFQYRHRVSTSAPRSFRATRSLRVRSMF
jgi:hypothetical protein